jgi:hypothetical protein
MRFGPAALVFDRIGAHVGADAAEFDCIGFAGHAERQGPDRQPTHRPHTTPTVRLAIVHPLVKQPSLGSGAVLDPDPLDMDQSALARTEQIVL